MTTQSTRKAQSERGVALLIAIFSLLLISGVAISMIVSSGTESALNANYKRNVAAFYAAQAGLEEARGRLVPCAPDSFWPPLACTDAVAYSKAPTDNLFRFDPLDVSLGGDRVLYVVVRGDTDPFFDPRIDPGASSPLFKYYDFQYPEEFKDSLVPPPVQNSVRIMTAEPGTFRMPAGLPAMNYKWFRINLKSERMGTLDLDGLGGATNDLLPVRAMSSDAQCLTGGTGCTADPNATVTTAPVYRVTAMAIDLSGAERVVQAEMTMPPVFNPNGAISSEAGVDINGNFNAFGAWPPVVLTTCSGVRNVPTCGTYDGKQMVGDCNNIYVKATDTCGGKPRSHNDYCGTGAGVNGVSSAGAVNADSYEKAPDEGVGCDTQGNNCIYTASPQQGVSENTPNWPYDMDEIINLYRPPVSEPIKTVDADVECGEYDANGNRVCKGQTLTLGTLPSPFPVPAGQTATNDQPKITFADVGPGGLLRLTASSSGSGILVVEGDLEIEGGFQWYGLIIVKGVVKFVGGGADPKNIIGGILAGSSVTNATAFSDIGGGVNITYSSCAFRKSNGELPLRYLGFREISRPRPTP